MLRAISQSSHPKTSSMVVKPHPLTVKENRIAGTLLFSMCRKAIPNSFVNTSIISLDYCTHACIYIYIYIYIYMDVHIYIYRVYINVLIPKVWLKNLSLAEMYTLWSLSTQIN